MSHNKEQTLLIILAHPDDESFSSGGTLAHYAAQGVHVALVCATRGEVGEIADPELATPETLAEVREAELRCACEALGIKDLTFLGYRDSGMADTPDNHHPQAFANAPAEKVVGQLVGIIRRVRPQVVITFDPDGGYGHPDHIAIHNHTVAAFHAAADSSRYPEQGLSWQPARLLYTVLPHSLFEEMYRQMVEAGIDTSNFDHFEKEDRRGWPDDQVDIIMDVSDTVEVKWSALRCHRTQFGPDNPFQLLPETTIKQIMSREHFVLAWPESKTNLQSNELFAG